MGGGSGKEATRTGNEGRIPELWAPELSALGELCAKLAEGCPGARTPRTALAPWRPNKADSWRAAGVSRGSSGHDPVSEMKGEGYPQILLLSGTNCLQRAQRILLMFSHLWKGPQKTETGWMDERVEGGLLLCFFRIKTKPFILDYSRLQR